MKLLVVIVQKEDAGELAEAFRDHGYASTMIGSTGGFLRKGNATFLLGVEEEDLEARLALIRAHCKKRTVKVNPYPAAVNVGEGYYSEPIEVEIGGAVLFLLSLDHFAKY